MWRCDYILENLPDLQTMMLDEKNLASNIVLISSTYVANPSPLKQKLEDLLIQPGGNDIFRPFLVHPGLSKK